MTTRRELEQALRTRGRAYGYVVWHPDDGRYIELIKADLIASLREGFALDEEVPNARIEHEDQTDVYIG